MDGKWAQVCVRGEAMWSSRRRESSVVTPEAWASQESLLELVGLTQCYFRSATLMGTREVGKE